MVSLRVAWHGHSGENVRMQLPVMPPLAPMLAKAVSTLPDGPVIFEPKWDGFRSIIFRDGDEVEIGSRNGKPMTRYFPELVEALKANLPSRCVLDGEIILVGSGGDRLDFDALQQRIYPAASRVKLLAVQTPASFVAFDLLALDDEDLTGRPCHERRTVLEEVLARCAAPVHVTAATRDRTTAQRWFDQFEGAGLDGIVARPVDGRYLPDKRSMFKIKDERTADCVLAGYRLHTSGLGRIGSPLRPERVVEVKYDHMEGERFRHTAQFVRWRPDREPRSCTFEQLEQPVEFDLAAVLGSGGD